MELSVILDRSSPAMRKPYPTDLNNDQWEMASGVIPPAVPKPGCDPTDLRDILNALLYQNKTGCQWDMLPHDLPPKTTAFAYYPRCRPPPTSHPLRPPLPRPR